MRKTQWFRPRPMGFPSAQDWADRAVTEQQHGWTERSALLISVLHLARQFHGDKPIADLERRAREAELLALAYQPGMLHELLLALSFAYLTMAQHKRQDAREEEG